MFDPRDPCHYLCPGYRPSTGALREVLDPGLLIPVGLWAETTGNEVEAALDALAAAQRGWRALDAKTRAAHLHRLAARIEAASLTLSLPRVGLTRGVGAGAAWPPTVPHETDIAGLEATTVRFSAVSSVAGTAWHTSAACS